MSILEYTSYRAFLQAALDDARRRNPRFSATAFARQLGMKSNTSLIKILRGQREAGPEIRRRVIRHFRLAGKEAAYFEDLVRLSRAKRDPAESYLLMREMRRRNRDFRLLNEEEFAAISGWWFYAIRQMTRLADFDEAQIASRLRFRVSARDLRRAVDVMLGLGLLERAEGRLRATSKALNTSDGVASEALKRFHEGMLENARRAIREIPVHERMIAGVTLAIRAADLDRAREYWNRVLDVFTAEFEADAPDFVYQAEVQLFPLTRKGDGAISAQPEERQT